MQVAHPTLEFTELEPMEAMDDSLDFTRGFALGVIIGILALT
ncbi:MpaA2 family daptide-type RiPP [uncultured Microbacterium sp.]|nr:MpaA2 family daptide-type RiPP [uncultured Microbacterium sp.]